MRTTEEMYMHRINAKRGRLRSNKLNNTNKNSDLTIKLKQEDNCDKSLVNLFIKTGEISGMMKAITPAISDFVKQKHSSKVAKFKPKISSQISKFNKESSVLNNSESLSKFRKTQPYFNLDLLCDNKVKKLNKKLRELRSSRNSRVKHIKYMDYFINSCDNLSKEFKHDKVKFSESLTNLHCLIKHDEVNMDRILNDADSSMIQLFTERMEQINGTMTDGEKFERIKEFKEFLKDDFNISNFLLESYIDDELNIDNNIKLLRYDRIIMKYTTKFKLTRKQRIRYTLHEPVIDTTEKLKLFNNGV